MNSLKDLMITDKCVDLVGYCLSKQCNGFDIVIKTPLGKVHCNFDFEIELKDQENEK